MKKSERGLWRCYPRPPRAKYREKTWRLVLVTPDGKHTRLACKDAALDEAGARRLAELVQRSYRETGSPPGDLEMAKGTATTVGDVVARNLAWRTERGPVVEGCSLASLQKLQQIQRELGPTLLRVTEERLDRAAVVLAQDALRATGKGPSCVNGLLAYVAAAWAWGLDRGMVTKPWPRVRRLKVPRTKKRAPTPSEVQAIFSWLRSSRARAYWLPCFAALYDSTARTTDVLNARERDLDRETGRLRLYVRKTRTTEDVWLTPETLSLLPRRSPDGYLFLGRYGGGKPASRHTTKSVMVRACKALGIENVDVHSFRRKGVEDICRTPGVAREQAMKVTGHRDPVVFHGYQVRAQDDMAAVWQLFQQSRGPHPAAVDLSGARVLGALHHAASQEMKARPAQVLSGMTQGRVALPTPRQAAPAPANAGARPVGADVPAGCRPTSSGVLRLTGEAARQAADTLASLCALGRETRAALAALCGDAELRAALLRALADAWPAEADPPSTVPAAALPSLSQDRK